MQVLQQDVSSAVWQLKKKLKEQMIFPSFQF